MWAFRLLRVTPCLVSASLATHLPSLFAAGTGSPQNCSRDVTPDGTELLGTQLSASDALRAWGAGSAQDALNRIGHDDVDPARRVIVVVGITGAGKSSTANTLSGRTHKPFAQSNTVTSVTQAISHRDYSFVNLPWRVVDTPGLCDTNRPSAAIAGELGRLARLAPHGIAAFVIVVPRGRLTAEHERALSDVVAVFGRRALSHAIVAVTSATDTAESAGGLMSRDALLEEVGALPLAHFFRRLVAAVEERIVPVENRLDTQRQISRMMMHQRIPGIEDAGGGRYALGPEFSAALAAMAAGGGAAAATLGSLIGGEPASPASDAHWQHTSLSVASASAASGAPLAVASMHVLLERCRQAEFRRQGDGQRMWRLECEVGDATPPPPPPPLAPV